MADAGTRIHPARWPRIAPETRLAREVLRFGLSGGIAMALLFVGAWTATGLPDSPTEMFVELFTSSPSATPAALKEGVLIAALFGFFGTVFGLLAWKAISFLERR